jgi:heat-inducible transcriptional repressor
MEEALTDRSRQVLRLVVEEYVATARAVGSGQLRAKHNLPYSPATLRNEMAELERRGYLTHLHTSGGRVPSEAGYRAFVRHFLDNFGVTPADMRRIEHQFHQVEGDLDPGRWAELAASVLAQLARNAAVVTIPRSLGVTLRQAQLVRLGERSALLVAVLDDGTVRQGACALPADMSQEALNSLSVELTDRLAGRAPGELAARVEGLSGPAAEVAPQLLQMLGRSPAPGSMIYSGLMNMLSQPEFQQTDQARPVVEMLEDGTLVSRLADRVSASPGVHVIIGSENPLQEMSSCSIVAASYYARPGGHGLLTVVGPTRMQYDRTISSVYYVSRLLSRTLGAGN